MGTGTNILDNLGHLRKAKAQVLHHLQKEKGNGRYLDTLMITL